MAASIVKQGAFLKYPAPPGDTNLGLAMKNGPASYTTISTGTPPTGGFRVAASDFGLTSIVLAFPAYSDNGAYVAYPLPASANNAPQTAVRYMICAVISGAETSGDLSAYSFPFFALGG